MYRACGSISGKKYFLCFRASIAKNISVLPCLRGKKKFRAFMPKNISVLPCLCGKKNPCLHVKKYFCASVPPWQKKFRAFVSKKIN